MPDNLEFDIGRALVSQYDEDHLTVQIDAYGEGESGVVPYELHSPYGFMSRPLDPELDPEGEPIPHKSCQTLYALEGGAGHAWVQCDPRVVAKLPKLEKGGAQMHADTGAFIQLQGKTGRLSQYVPYAFDADGKATKGHMIAVDPTGNSIQVLHGDGMSIQLYDGRVLIRNAAGDAFVEINSDGITLNGNVNISGSLTVGGPAAVPLATAGLTPTMLIKAS